MLEAKAKSDKLKVFLSYSRDDLKFADQLDAALDLTGFEAFLDRQGISGAEDWKRRLGDLIRDADTVVFVLSPSSAKSDICAWEVEEAARMRKRIIPVLCRPLEDAEPPPRLKALNYIYFYDEPNAPGSGFGAGLAKLVPALNTDLDWVREHTRLLARATEWEASGRAANRLLFGSVIADAKAWAARRPKDAPEPSALHLDYIRASEQAETARTDEAHKQVEERSKAISEREQAFEKAATAQRIRNFVLAAMTLAMVLAVWQWRVAVGATAAAEHQRLQAEARKTEAEGNVVMAREMTAMALLSAAQAGAAEQTKALNLPPVEIGAFQLGKDYLQTVSAVVEEMTSGRDTIANMFGSVKAEERATIVQNQAAFFESMAAISHVLVGDKLLAENNARGAAERYDKAIALSQSSASRLKGYFAPSFLVLTRSFGRAGVARKALGDKDGAVRAFNDGLGAIEQALAKEDLGDDVKAEKAWFEARIAESGEPAAAAAQPAPASPAAPP